MRITCVDPDSHPDGHVPGLQLARTVAATGQSCPFGEVIDVDDDIAGHPPKGEPGDKGHDPGAGLLAQTDVWALADGEKAPRHRKSTTTETTEPTEESA